MTKLSNAMSWLPVSQLIAHVRTPLYGNAYALMLSAVSSSALGMVYWLLAARYYPPEVVGLNSAAISATMFLGGVAGLYLDGALIRFLPEAGPGRGRLIHLAYLISAIVAVLVGLVFLAGLGWWSPTLSFLTASPGWAAAFLATVASTSLFTLQDGVLTGLRESTWVALKNLVASLIKVGLLILFAHTWSDLGILGAWLIPGILILIPVQALIERRLLPQPQPSSSVGIQSQVVARYVAGNYLASLFNLASTLLLPLLVVSLAGTAAGAYFYLPWVIANALRLVTTGMSVSLTVEGATDQQQVGVYGRAALRHTARLLVPVVALLIGGAPLVLQLFGRNYAAEGVDVLRLLVLATLPTSIIVLYLGLARVHNHIWRVVLVQAVWAALGLGLSYIGLMWYGIVGVGWASLVSATLVAGGLMVTELRAVLRPVEPTLAAAPVEGGGE